MQTALARKRSAAYRQAREAEGRKQLSIWVENTLTERLDEAVRAGQFKNRSEAISAAVSRFVEEMR